MASAVTSLTAEQHAAVIYPGHIMLSACPGSGKTRAIIAKLMRAVEDVRGTPRAIACITYTNTAVYEIEARLRRHLPADDELHFDVSTIHSFCLNHILRPFRHLVPGLERHCQILTPDSDAFATFVTNACADHNRFNLRRSDFEEFANLQVNLKGEPIGASVVSGGVRPLEAQLFWQLIRKKGYVDFCSILYLSYCLLRDHPYIADALASRFAALMVDEFQDTTDIQVEILALIAQRRRTTFFLVGDPSQSIFGFAGARPDLAADFAERIGAATHLTLTRNFRSSRHIVAHAETLLPRAPPMIAAGPHRDYQQPPVHRHASSAFSIITDQFLPALAALSIPLGNAAVLAPTWFTLFPLGRQLRQYGIPIVGPGARPYRRNRLMAPLAEQICGYLITPEGAAIPAIERALYNTLLEMTGSPPARILTYDGRTVVFRLIAAAARLQQNHSAAKDWLLAAAPAFSTILSEAGLITPAEVPLLQASVLEMFRDMQNNRVDIDHLTLDDLGIYASPETALKLATLHNAKGREFDAVAMIDLHEGRIPFYRATTQAEIDDARRLFYVGVTRARCLLLYSTDEGDRRNRPTRFLTVEGVGVC